VRSEAEVDPTVERVMVRIGAIARRFPGLRLAAGESPERDLMVGFRALRSLPVEI
jgi:hypothetical protein